MMAPTQLNPCFCSPTRSSPTRHGSCLGHCHALLVCCRGLPSEPRHVLAVWKNIHLVPLRRLQLSAHESTMNQLMASHGRDEKKRSFSLSMMGPVPNKLGRPSAWPHRHAARGDQAPLKGGCRKGMDRCQLSQGGHFIHRQAQTEARNGWTDRLARQEFHRGRISSSSHRSSNTCSLLS